MDVLVLRANGIPGASPGRTDVSTGRESLYFKTGNSLVACYHNKPPEVGIGSGEVENCFVSRLPLVPARTRSLSIRGVAGFNVRIGEH